MALLKFDQIIGKTLQILSQANNYIASISANISGSRNYNLPDKNGDIALVRDIDNFERYGKFTGLKSSYYFLGSDLVAIPVNSGQSAIVSYHGLQLGGINASNICDTNYQLIDPPNIANIQGVDAFCVGIRPGSGNNPFYPGLGNSTPLDVLALYQIPWHINGTFLNCRNGFMNTVFSIDLSGAVSIAGNKIIGARDTGWTAATGTANKGNFDTNTATVAQCAQRIKALEDMLRSHGLIN